MRIMFKKLAIVILVALFAAQVAVAAPKTSPVQPNPGNDPVHQILQRLSKNLLDQSRKTTSYALQTLNPLYPGTTNVINALNLYTQSAQRLVTLLSTDSVNEELLRDQVSTLALGSQQVAFAINALGAHPALNGLVLRWNQCVTVLNQIKAFVPTRDAERVARFDALHAR
jgi:hypothetical protein